MKYRPCQHCAHEGPYLRVRSSRISRKVVRACEACRGQIKENK